MSFKNNWPWHFVAKLGISPVPKQELLQDYWASENLWSTTPCEWRYLKFTWVYFCEFLIQFVPLIWIVSTTWRWIGNYEKSTTFGEVFMAVSMFMISLIFGLSRAWDENKIVKEKTAIEKSKLPLK